jgi:hypothetical protein
VSSVPGFPIYEMMNGDLRLPFPNGATKEMLYLTEAEVLKSSSKREPKDLSNISVIFSNVKKQILNLETKKEFIN